MKLSKRTLTTLISAALTAFAVSVTLAAAPLPLPIAQAASAVSYPFSQSGAVDWARGTIGRNHDVGDNRSGETFYYELNGEIGFQQDEKFSEPHLEYGEPHRVDSDYNQCIDLIRAYYQEVFGVDPVGGSANGYETNDLPHSWYRKIGADRTDILPGDIVVLVGNPYFGVGHIGIAVNSEEMVDQNWNSTNHAGNSEPIKISKITLSSGARLTVIRPCYINPFCEQYAPGHSFYTAASKRLNLAHESAFGEPDKHHRVIRFCQYCGAWDGVVHEEWGWSNQCPDCLGTGENIETGNENISLVYYSSGRYLAVQGTEKVDLNSISSQAQTPINVNDTLFLEVEKNSSVNAKGMLPYLQTLYHGVTNYYNLAGLPSAQSIGGLSQALSPLGTAEDIEIGIEDDAFSDRYSLTTVALGPNVTSIGDSAFSNCPNLTTLVLEGENVTIGASAFRGSSITDFSFLERVVSIGDFAFGFGSHSTVTELVIPENVKYIGVEAFSGLAGLRKVTFLGDVPPEIGTGAFGDSYNSDLVAITPIASHKAYREALSDSMSGATVESHIYSVEDLATLNSQMPHLTYDGIKSRYVLESDLDLSGISNWTPITLNGEANHESFTEFDGQGHTISNLNISAEAQFGSGRSYGLFDSVTDSVIKNLTIMDANIAVTGAAPDTGVLAGIIIGSDIVDVHIVDANVSGDGNVAGVTGLMSGNSQISDCEVSGSISSSSHCINGIAYSDIHHDSSSIINCINYAALSGEGEISGIGIAKTISGSYNYGKITVVGQNDGFVSAGSANGIGDAETIADCENNGVIEIVSLTINHYSVYGIGQANAITDCVNSGNIITTGTQNESVATGSVLGIGQAGSFENCTNNGDISIKLKSPVIAGIGMGYVPLIQAEFRFINCANYGDISGEDCNTIAGIALNGDHIEGCVNAGNITANYGGNVGGIAAFGSSSIIKSYNMGSIKIANSAEVAVGGIIGAAGEGITVENCFNTGNIEVEANYAESSRILRGVGGIIGFSGGKLNMSNTYNAGSVTFNKVRYAGGIVGGCYSLSDSVHMENIFYANNMPRALGLAALNGNPIDSFVNVASYACSQFILQTSYTGYDFTRIWAIDPQKNNGYPYLQGMGEPLAWTEAVDGTYPSRAESASDYDDLDLVFIDGENTTKVIGEGSVGLAIDDYQFVAEITNGVAPYSFTVESQPDGYSMNIAVEGKPKNNVPYGLPKGITLDPETGIISGTPLDAYDDMAINVIITDSAGKTNLFGHSSNIYTVFFDGIAETQPPQTYDLTVVNGAGSGRFAEGETIRIGAMEAPAGRRFINWIVTEGNVTLEDANSPITTFIMPSSPVTVKANYEGEQSAPVPVSGVVLNKSAITMMTGSTETLTATVAPDDATNQAVTWSSDTPGVAMADTGGTVTALSVGTAVITVTTDDGSFADTCVVTVDAADSATDKIFQGLIQPDNISGLASGTKKTASALGLPSTVTMVTDSGNISAIVDWDVDSSSYNPGIAAEQTFTVSGAAQLPAGVVNTGGVSQNVTVSVTVNALTLPDNNDNDSEPPTTVPVPTQPQPAPGTSSGGSAVAPTPTPTPTSTPTLTPTHTPKNNNVIYVTGVGGAGDIDSETLDIPVEISESTGDVAIRLNTLLTENLIADALKAVENHTPESDNLSTNSASAAVVAKPVVTFDLSSVESAKQTTFTADSARAFGAAKVALTVKLPDAQITFEPETLYALGSDAASDDSAQITVEATVIPKRELSGMQAAQVKAYEAVTSINVFSGGSKTDVPVTVGLPYAMKLNESPAAVCAWRLGDNGDLTKLDSFYDPETGMVTFEIISQSYFVVGYDPVKLWENTFSDVPDGEWFYDAVAYTNYHGMMAGYGNGIFAPQDGMTRAMFVTALWNIDGKTAPKRSTAFNDLNADEWYIDSIMWAAENDIAGGDGDGGFAPDRFITRQEMAVILLNYANCKGYEVIKNRDMIDYADYNQISEWAVTAVETLSEAGVLSGSNGEFMPLSTVTRAEVAQAFTNFLRFTGNTDN